MLTGTRRALLQATSWPAYLFIYWRNLRRQGDRCCARENLFREFTRRRPDERPLQIGVRGAKYGPGWVSVDLYDQSPEIDYHYDIMHLGFSDGAFDRVVCNAILEHVENPARAIGEIWRVLKVGGQVWVEVPFHQPYHPHPSDFWRVSPEGLEKWMRGFKRLSSGVFSIRGCPFYTGAFYWGEKTALDA